MKRKKTPRGERAKTAKAGSDARKQLPLPCRLGEGWSSSKDKRTILTISNRQRTRQIRSRLLRQIVATLLKDFLEITNVELGINLVNAGEMAHINQTFLRHEGATDVITFNYGVPETRNLELGAKLHGEIFICVDEAIVHACRFRTTWRSEIIRYLIHGLLHLLGYDDHRERDRRRMKCEENRLLRRLTAEFDIKSLCSRR